MACLFAYGSGFLYHTYLYHFIRQDNRHNFSVYFYTIYLNVASFDGPELGNSFICLFVMVESLHVVYRPSILAEYYHTVVPVGVLLFRHILRDVLTVAGLCHVEQGLHSAILPVVYHVLASRSSLQLDWTEKRTGHCCTLDAWPGKRTMLHYLRATCS